MIKGNKSCYECIFYEKDHDMPPFCNLYHNRNDVYDNELKIDNQESGCECCITVLELAKQIRADKTRYNKWKKKHLIGKKKQRRINIEAAYNVDKSNPNKIVMTALENIFTASFIERFNNKGVKNNDDKTRTN